MKLKHNVEVSRTDISAGDTVRTRRPRNRFTKGYAPIWSDKVFTVQKVDGRHVYLEDGRRLALQSVQKVQDVEGQAQKRTERASKQASKEKRQERQLQQEGVVEERNIIPTRRRQPSRKATQAEPEPEEEEEEEEEDKYDIEAFLSQKTKKGRIYYRVKWQGYSLSEATWEPRTNLIQDIGKKAVDECVAEMRKRNASPRRIR